MTLKGRALWLPTQPGTVVHDCFLKRWERAKLPASNCAACSRCCTLLRGHAAIHAVSGSKAMLVLAYGNSPLACMHVEVLCGLLCIPWNAHVYYTAVMLPALVVHAAPCEWPTADVALVLVVTMCLASAPEAVKDAHGSEVLYALHTHTCCQLGWQLSLIVELASAKRTLMCAMHKVVCVAYRTVLTCVSVERVKGRR